MSSDTSRLGIPYPVSTDPANVPSDMENLANALDTGSNSNYSGAAVFVAAPGGVGALPTSPITGTFYSVNSSPPYLLFYTGENTTATPTAPGGWRLIGQAGTNIAVMSTAAPGNSAQVGTQPVWAPLDHRHASPAWGTVGNVTTSVPGDTALAGSVGQYADVGHRHAREAGTRTATVTAVNLSPPTVNINFGAGVISGVPFLQSYYPVSGDTVYVGEIGGGDSTPADLIVLGKAPTSGTLGSHKSYYGVSGAIFGGAPPAANTGRFLEQIGVANGSTDAFGNLYVPFPVSFPSGVVEVTAELANVSAGFFQKVTCPSNTISTGGFTAEVWQSGPGSSPNLLTNQPGVQISWRATGW